MEPAQGESLDDDDMANYAVTNRVSRFSSRRLHRPAGWVPYSSSPIHWLAS